MFKRYCFVLLLCANKIMAQNQPELSYPIDSASIEYRAVPKGEVIKLSFDQSNVFPGTTRDVWIYVPAQYDPSQAACVYINQDGLLWGAPTVFDNLIYAKQMPITIGIFVSSGKIKATNTTQAQDRFNRSFEYDGLGDAYARFLLDELLPFIAKQKTKDGKNINLSDQGNDRAIGGISSGAVCAFTAAWEHPQAFSRVFSSIGTYVGLRGADRYPTLIRKYEPKPLRIFLEDGTNDLNIYAGDWWKANEMMERALGFAGYELSHSWADGSHNAKHGTAVFPAAMRWLWQDWPKAVAQGKSKNQFLNDLLIDHQNWQRSPIDSIVFGDAMSIQSHAGFRYEINQKGNLLVNKKPQKLPVTFTKKGCLGLSPDQTQLYWADGQSQWVWIFLIQENGQLAHPQRYGWLHCPDQSQQSGAAAIATDQDGRIFVATTLGVQILDQLGRVNAILPLATQSPTAMAFSKKQPNVLWVQTPDGNFGRKLKTLGAFPDQKPIKPQAPRL